MQYTEKKLKKKINRASVRCGTPSGGLIFNYWFDIYLLESLGGVRKIFKEYIYFTPDTVIFISRSEICLFFIPSVSVLRMFMLSSASLLLLTC